MIVRLRLALFRICLLALIGAALLQATPSHAFIDADRRGSAFDATTSEVAILVQREDAGAVIQVEPFVPPLDIADESPKPAQIVQVFGFPPKQTGPPSRHPRGVTPPTRAPPALT